MIPDDHGGKFVEMPVLGTFESGINDYDSQFILMRIEELEKMFGLNSGEITGVEIKLRDPDSSEKIGSTITDEMGLLYEVTTWQELNSDLFSAIKLEKVVSSIIMGSMVVVSMLNLMALIVLMMMKRLPQISLLKAIGLRAAEIEKLLISGGLLVARKGVIAGLAGGLIISLIIQRFRIIELDPEIYLINSLPVEVSPAICGTVLAFCMAAAYAASKVAAKRVAQGISMEGLKIR
jgi:lipoprotein-releasing system permease protein